MKLIKPSFKIMPFDGKKIIENIELAGRTCYKSEHKITADSKYAFVKMIIKRGHESVLEHEKITVRIICDRGVSHELVRHRIASYSQESTRYCDYGGKDIQFIIPCFFDNIKEGLFNYIDLMGYNYSYKECLWLDAMLCAEISYQDMIENGMKPEEARSVLPNSLKTEIVVTMNLRQWRHFFRLRTAKPAHPQMREIAVPLLTEFKKYIPVIFDDILTEGNSNESKN